MPKGLNNPKMFSQSPLVQNFPCILKQHAYDEIILLNNYAEMK